MVEQLTVDKFLSTLSSKEPVPGGGGASALAGALGNALGQMVANRDEEVFAPLAAAYGLPTGTEEEKAHKAAVMEQRLLDASYVPLEVMEKAVEMLGILDVLAVKGSRMAVSDVGVGVQFVRTALLGAVMNVYINTKSMKDRGKAGELNREAEELVRTGTEAADRIYGVVLAGLRG